VCASGLTTVIEFAIAGRATTTFTAETRSCGITGIMQVVGLDAGQVIRWRSWHRWTALCLLAYLYLAAPARPGLP
jgi:hypothetical protein